MATRHDAAKKEFVLKGRARALVIATFISVLSVLSAANAGAQSQNAAIAGVVRDGAGTPLEGVTVEAASPMLIEKTRTVATDARGAYKIVDLRPGVYAVTFTAAGFNALRREGIDLSSSFTGTVSVAMRRGDTSETL